MARAYISRASKKISNSGIMFEIDLQEVIDVLGAAVALSREAKGREYMDAVVDVAIAQVEDTFNTEAAAYAASTGLISHMYEWGTIGINKGRTNMRMKPNNPAARLWSTYVIGSGFNREIRYAFKPSFANVPKPTMEETGMSSEVISKLGDHVFHWKAEVMEEGQDVTISPKRAKFLLIPAYKENRQYMRPNDIKRGYSLLKGPLVANPGHSRYYGAFEKFWDTFWLAGPANQMLQDYTTGMLIADFEPEFRAKRTHRTIRKAGQFSVTAEVERAAVSSSAKVVKKANQRKAERK